MPSDLLWSVVDAVLPPERGGSSSASTVKWTQRTPADAVLACAEERYWPDARPPHAGGWREVIR